MLAAVFENKVFLVFKYIDCLHQLKFTNDAIKCN